MALGFVGQMGAKRLRESRGCLLDRLAFRLGRLGTKYTRSLISRRGHRGLLKATTRSTREPVMGLVALHNND
jgi:hypothetical protein